MSSLYLARSITGSNFGQSTEGWRASSLLVDRTAAPPREGIDSVQTIHATHAATGTGSSGDTSATKYSKSDTRPIISYVARAMLGKYGAPDSGGGGAVQLVRAG